MVAQEHDDIFWPLLAPTTPHGDYEEAPWGLMEADF